MSDFSFWTSRIILMVWIENPGNGPSGRNEHPNEIVLQIYQVLSY